MYSYGNHYHNYGYSSSSSNTSGSSNVIETSGSDNISQTVAYLKNHDFDRALKNIKKMILPYLNNKDFATPTSRIGAGLTINGTAQYEVRNNVIAIDFNQIKRQNYSEKFQNKFLMLTLGHELTHAWQAVYAPYAPNPHEEGHATWIESQLAKKIDAKNVFDNTIKHYKNLNNRNILFNYVTMYEYYKDVHNSTGLSGVEQTITNARSGSTSAHTQRDVQSSHSQYYDYAKHHSWYGR